jgi:chromosome segregation ATPase
MLHWLLAFWYVPVMVALLILVLALLDKVSTWKSLYEMWKDAATERLKRAAEAEQQLDVLRRSQEGCEDVERWQEECEYLQNLVARMNSARNETVEKFIVVDKALTALRKTAMNQVDCSVPIPESPSDLACKPSSSPAD